MSAPLNYYKNYKEKYASAVAKLSNQMVSLSLLRLLVFVLAGTGIYVTFKTWQIALTIAVAGIVVFLYVLSKYNDLKRERSFKKALVGINEDEIKIASGDFHNRNEGLKYQDPNHHYSLDIDLFGRGSFFQFINRTTILEGEEKLADALKANDTKNISLRQEAIKELSEKTEWRQFYAANSSLVEVETPVRDIVGWLKKYRSFLPKTMRWLPLVFILTSTLLLGLVIFNVLNPEIIGYWLLVGLGVTGMYVKKTNALSSGSDRLKDTFRQYTMLLNLIENESFSSQLLRQKQEQIKSESKKASTVFSELSRALDALDNRNNIIGAIFGNGYFLTDIKNGYRIEKWIENYGEKVSDWFDVVSFFDAYNSLGGYVFNHAEFVFPEIEREGNIINASRLGHPLLDKTKRVDSDVIIKNEEFFIVTGANMAGKSTFLRTISLHIVMANVGLPICAKSTKYSPVKLITSMRTTDSLTDDSSYFFSELTRLKYIVDAIQKEPYFIILDEILKGTNSTDKAIGSRKFVEKLVASNATGIIATHDLSLCEIEQELNQVKNYYFDAEIINDELHFDYTLKEGVCQNMNASFLLKKMEIV